MVEQDGLYEKYRVFREPEEASEHPVEVEARWTKWERGVADAWPEKVELQEITDSFLFVLKPDTDHHARVAIAAYAESVTREKPRLANDLRMALATLDMEEGEG